MPDLFETKREYCDRMALTLTSEMCPFLEELAIPCDCSNPICRGWKLRTMWRDELPPMALAKSHEDREKMRQRRTTHD